VIELKREFKDLKNVTVESLLLIARKIDNE
jgi:hypothetical protein